MDWCCCKCRREGVRWFVLRATAVVWGPGNIVKVDVGLEEELAEVDHFLLTGCDGRVEREGFAMVREIPDESLRDPLWLEVCHGNC
jgi:hypothetical protein